MIDTAMILALCHVLLTENLHDRKFLDRCTVGFDKFAPSLADKTPEKKGLLKRLLKRS